MGLKKRKISIHGHRGARGRLPENTMPAFEYAAECGVEYIELDILATADDRLVVCHDPILNPEICLDPKGDKIKEKIILRQLDYSDLAHYQCGSLVNPRFPEQRTIPDLRIPLLEEVIQWAMDSNSEAVSDLKLNIECKSVPAYADLFPNPMKYAKLLVRTLEKHDFIDRALVQSFDHRILEEVRKLNKKLELSALFGDNFVDYAKLAKDLKIRNVSLNLHWLNKQTVKELHKANIKIHVWTANSIEEWDRLISCGVDGIITDFPDELNKHLRSKGLR